MVLAGLVGTLPLVLAGAGIALMRGRTAPAGTVAVTAARCDRGARRRATLAVRGDPGGGVGAYLAERARIKVSSRLPLRQTAGPID